MTSNLEKRLAAVEKEKAPTVVPIIRLTIDQVNGPPIVQHIIGSNPK